MAKGGEYERTVCKQLSSWWTSHERDDVFWRSSNSGGRATIRSRKGKTTHGSYGDIVALDPVGKPLLELFTIELKRGYPKGAPWEMVEKTRSDVPKQFELFVSQAMAAAHAAGSKTWLLIHRRDKCQALLYCSAKTMERLEEKRGMPLSAPRVEFFLEVRADKKTTRTCRIACVPLDTFFAEVSPKYITELLYAHA